MSSARRPNLSEHTAHLLLSGFGEGRWAGRLPGVRALSKELQVSRDTVRDALKLLEREGALSHQGAGRSRVISSGNGRRSGARRSLRVGILLPEPLEGDCAHSRELILGVRRELEALGHVCFIASKTGRNFHGSAPAKMRYIKECRADAWILYSANRAMLEAAAEGDLPMFALGGDLTGLQMAGANTGISEPMVECVDQLVKLGHRRISLIGPERWYVPKPSPSAESYLARLKHHGIPVDAGYNLPAWEHTPQGLNTLLKALFFATPPTALLIVEPECVGPALVFAAERGLRVPDQLSVINVLPDPMQDFYAVPLAHFRWPVRQHVKSVARWVRSLARGEEERKVTETQAVFVPGGSIGAARREVSVRDPRVKGRT